MKKVVSIMLTLALIITSISFSSVGKISADTDWKSTAITAPVEGKLVGAGYMDIVFNTTLENAKSYTVYFDGAEVGTFVADADTVKSCEVYTTQVSAHTASVVATLNDDTTVQTNTRTFYVSKKGMALGADMSSTVKMNQMNVSWYYNWALQPFNTIVDVDVPLVPMVWGEENIADITQVNTDLKYIMGFNEADHPDQANLSNEQMIELWPQIMSTGMRTVSPSSCNPNGVNSMLDSFFESIEIDESLTCDSVSLHFYTAYPSQDKGEAQRALKCIDEVYEKYGKPIWLTEVSVRGASKVFTDNSYENPVARKQIEEFLKTLVEGLEARPYVERYAWFSYDIKGESALELERYSGGSALFDYETGGLTDLGILYASLGNPAGYEVKPITDIYEKSTTEPETTKPVITVKPTTKPVETTIASVNKPAKVNLKKAQNVKKKSVTLTWKKVTNAKKYQVQYSLSKKFKKAKKFKTVTKTTTKTKFKIKKLTKKKTYYFRVRGVNGKTYGVWSNVKKVKVKK